MRKTHAWENRKAFSKYGVWMLLPQVPGQISMILWFDENWWWSRPANNAPTMSMVQNDDAPTAPGDWSLLLSHPLWVMWSFEWFRRRTWPYQVKSLQFPGTPNESQRFYDGHSHKLSGTLKEFESYMGNVCVCVWNLGKCGFYHFGYPKMPQT